MLSGGERSRLYLCCLLKENPDILFLDEPTNHLDINSREILEDAIKEYSGAVICVSHDRFFIDKCADKVLGFKDRKASLYDSYYFYRKAVLSDVSVPAAAEEPKQENENTVRSVNRAQERKESAKRRQRIADIEAEQKELEAKFGGSCSSEDLKRYEENAERLSSLYDEYFELNDD